MIYRQVGKTDLKASVIGFGCWVVSGSKFWTGTDDQSSIRAIQAAFDMGINFFDVAPVYGYGHAERLLGQALKGKRDKVIIATKCGLVWDESVKTQNILTKENIFREIDESLERLGTDYVDIYQMHWPDYATPIEESMEALTKLQEQGKIRHIGASNFPLFLLNEARQYGEIESHQCLYNMLQRNDDNYHNIALGYRTELEILPDCRQNQVAFIPYSPLAQGLLTDGFDPEGISASDVRNANPLLQGERLAKSLAVVKGLKEFAQEVGKPLSQLALAWMIKDETITTILAGATKIEHIQDNVESTTWELDDQVYQRINEFLMRTART
jgi:aryl-alcohol dehydrogenase-like predicted oxidoreductase